jgi:hypothetical protein
MNPVLTISFVTQRNPFSALIRWGTHSDFSHTEVIMPDDYRLGALFSGGVQRRPPGYAKFSREEQVPCSPRQAEAFYRFLCQQLGNTYDWQAIAGFAFNRQWRDPSAWL